MNTMKKSVLIFCLCILAISLFTSGCIDELVPESEENESVNLKSYELEVFHNNSNASTLNTSTFYLSVNGTAKVVHLVANASMIDVVPLEDLTQNSDEILSNIVIVAGNSSMTDASYRTFETFASFSEEEIVPVEYYIEEDVIRGQKHQYLKFNETITGIVAFTQAGPLGQDFLYIPTHPSVVRFVLPGGYDTGNSFIGKVSPQPDHIYYDDMGRKVLVWYDVRVSYSTITNMAQDLLGTKIPEEDIPFSPVSVKFYKDSAPGMLLIGTSILGAGALLVLGNYYMTRRRLVENRKRIEKSAEQKFRSRKKQ